MRCMGGVRLKSGCKTKSNLLNSSRTLKRPPRVEFNLHFTLLKSSLHREVWSVYKHSEKPLLGSFSLIPAAAAASLLSSLQLFLKCEGFR